LEQVEGINLAAVVAGKDGQAHRRADGAFETERALNAGRRVKAECRRAKSAEHTSGGPLLTTIRE
jgi:hypothetical protein